MSAMTTSERGPVRQTEGGEELGRWLDGRGLCVWLGEVGAVERPDTELAPSMARGHRRWLAGGHGDCYAVDELLRRRGLVLSEVPEGLWRTVRKRRRQRRVRPAERCRAAEQVRAGHPAREVATELGVSEKAVRNRAAAGREGRR